METDRPTPLQESQQSELIYKRFSSQFGEKYQIKGKTISEWKEHFRIPIPVDLTTISCKEADTLLLQFTQEASFYKGEAESVLQALRGVYRTRFREEFISQINHFKSTGKGKVPAKDTLQLLAEHEVSDLCDALTHGEIEVTFWKEMLSNINTCRRVIENATLNISVEMKANQAQQIFENSVNRYGE